MPVFVVSAVLVCVLQAPGTAAGQGLQQLVGQRFTAVVVNVADGDTVTIRVPQRGQTVRVRVHGIDAPERGEPFSTRARTFTRVTVFSKEVVVEGRDVDRYGRLVARIRIGATDLSAALLEAGLACHYRRYSSDPVLEAAETTARAAGAGFWAAGAAKPRCVARR
jgi:micrococcal nuclease